MMNYRQVAMAPGIMMIIQLEIKYGRLNKLRDKEKEQKSNVNKKIIGLVPMGIKKNLRRESRVTKQKIN